MIDETTKPLPLRRPFHSAGLFSILISFMAYAAGVGSGLKDDAFLGIFVFNYLLSGAYFLCLWIGGRFKAGKGGLDLFFLSLVLFLISAYSLNRVLPVFQQSVAWLNVALVLTGILYCSLLYFDRIGIWGRRLVALGMGISWSLFLYLGIYLLPLYPLSVPAALALGVSLHTFCPLLFVIFTLVWLFRKAPLYRNVTRAFCCGVGISLVVVVTFCLQWRQLDQQAASYYQRTLISQDQALPSWIRLAQELPHNWFTERYLKTGLVYSEAELSGNGLDWGLPSRRFDEVRKHDPLIMIATFFHKGGAINEEERIKILESQFNARYQTEERLWSGRDLRTTDVISNIRIWPQFRMAYTEKTITVAQGKTDAGRNGNEEALYTFHLPEGGVLTSLSLWINGVEARGILTTKGKANEAYRQIVGVENRDPSVVHWREGNRVTVRVFPVPAGGNRIFKIGVTAPLAFRQGQLAYDNIYFEGPDASDAREIVQVDWQQGPPAAAMAGFGSKGDGRFLKERDYIKDWHWQFPAVALSPDVFSFSGYTYHIGLYQAQRTATIFSKIYLDVNASWTEKEFLALVRAWKTVPVYVYDDELIRVTEAEAAGLFRQLHRKHFSLFPMQAIIDPGTALLVTKSGKVSPNTGDLKETPFAAALEAWLDQGQKLCLFNMGTEMTPYLRSLKEHRAFRYEQGNVAAALTRVRQQDFAVDVEHDDCIVIDNAGIMLRRTAGTSRGKAPDHFQRLFAYNHLMRQLGSGIYHNRETDTALVAEAQQANIVSPLSSLVVLETQADYDRFDIKASENSLQNASLQSKGAVPEPEEWALIAVALLLTVGALYQHKLKSLWKHS
ncbi:XrtN system VIT domain-containing protein [Taibaiella koreensis]|uniref:XrtN system VIT domain-containing protein n=1 Tax=Taibaiella koreensis TaxID=1268548 RepID=UPI000E59E808|nr:XrtN system VIT domain-containing protein [Taibaiella koreensis]